MSVLFIAAGLCLKAIKHHAIEKKIYQSILTRFEYFYLLYLKAIIRNFFKIKRLTNFGSVKEINSMSIFGFKLQIKQF